MKLALKALLSLALMAILLWQAEVRQIAAALAAAQGGLALAAFALFLMQQMIVAYAWHMLLPANGKPLPFMRTVETHVMGSFFGTFLPSSVGMDVIRAYRLGRYLERSIDSASSMFVTRVVGFLVNFLLALLAAIPVSYQLRNAAILGAVLAATLAFGAGVVLVLHPRASGLMKNTLARFKLAGVAAKLGAFREGIVALSRGRNRMLQLVGVSVIYQSIGIVIVYMLGRALDVDLSLWRYFVYIPLITAITVLPISLAGIGIREGAFVFFFAQAGVAPAQALSLSLLLFAQTLALALLGGVWYFLARACARPEKAA